MKDRDFLMFLYANLQLAHGQDPESENMQKLKAIICGMDNFKETPPNDDRNECDTILLTDDQETARIRKAFETFDKGYMFQRDKHGNYNQPIVHNLFIGFKNWWITGKRRLRANL